MPVAVVIAPDWLLAPAEPNRFSVESVERLSAFATTTSSPSFDSVSSPRPPLMPVEVVRAAEADSVEAQHAIISRGRRYALWSQHLVQLQRFDAHFAARRITDPRLPRCVMMKTTTHHPLSRASREVARILRRLVLAVHAS